MRVGPRSLRERIAARGGTLVLDSSERGARLEIGIPV
jgi:signal transduction histidine kinase